MHSFLVGASGTMGLYIHFIPSANSLQGDSHKASRYSFLFTLSLNHVIYLFPLSSPLCSLYYFLIFGMIFQFTDLFTTSYSYPLICTQIRSPLIVSLVHLLQVASLNIKMTSFTCTVLADLPCTIHVQRWPPANFLLVHMFRDSVV